MPVLNHYLRLCQRFKKHILYIFLSSLSIRPVFGNSLDGIVSYKNKQTSGVLFIFAKKFDGSIPMPLAIKRIVNPKFPVKFSLSEKDTMIKTIPFKGPFKVIARLTKSGNAMDKSGPQGETTKSLKIGAKMIRIEIK